MPLGKFWPRGTFILDKIRAVNPKKVQGTFILRARLFKISSQQGNFISWSVILFELKKSFISDLAKLICKV